MLSDRWRQDVEKLRGFASAQHPYHPVFVTLSGADLYGFPSEDGDYDLRGCHVVPMRQFSVAMLATRGMDKTEGLTVEVLDRNQQPEMDFVSHDIGKMLRLALKANGYVLEQITSPLVVETSETHAALKELVPRLITRRLSHHYNGFFSNQERLYDSQGTKKVKGLLYQYRVALTGIQVLRTGAIEANLPRLNEEFGSPLLAELIERKQSGELSTIEDDARFRSELANLEPALRRAYEESSLRLEVDDDTRKSLEALVWRRRLEHLE